MWALLVAGIGVVITFAFAFAKSSSHAEEISESHREELLSRKKVSDSGNMNETDK